MSDAGHEHRAHPSASESHVTPEKSMSHGTEHNLEEAEHAQHAAHSPFDKFVALTMAIVAAALACVTLLSHRAHAETLQDQIRASQSMGKANKSMVESGKEKTAGADQWALYQAKKQRGYMYAADADMLTALSRDAADSEAGKKTTALIAAWKDNAKRYDDETKELKTTAENFDKKADALRDKSEEEVEESKKFEESSELAHHRSNCFDLGELGIELALVLCSIAVLTKMKPFWLIGMLVGVIGVAVAGSGFYIDQLARMLPFLG
jgi:Domain of unknown function (DUF4337)